jgi:chromosome segregation ATPase
VSKNNSLFSTALSGFKKSEVVAYIDEINRKTKMEREAAEYERNSLQQENTTLSEKNSELGEKNIQLEKALSETESIKNQLSEASQRIENLTLENDLLKDDVSTQRDIIGSLQQTNTEISAKLEEMTVLCAKYEEKANAYDIDKLEAGGVLERAKAQADKLVSDATLQASAILSSAKAEAQAKADAIIKESEKNVADNVRKVKYLNKRKSELLTAFERIKDAAGGFYENVASVILRDPEE